MDERRVIIDWDDKSSKKKEKNKKRWRAKLIHRIYLPAKNITNCTFGGLKNNEVFITSATKGMNRADLQKFKYSGFLFSIKSNIKGIQQKKFILKNAKKRSLL